MTRLLLDTHTFVWSASQQRLSPELTDVIDSADDVFVSALALWEIIIKQATKRRIIETADVHLWFSQAMSASRFSLLPIEVSHIANVAHLPPHHGDPFDRLLVAQAQVERLVIVSKDRQLATYDVSVIWDGSN